MEGCAIGCVGHLHGDRDGLIVGRESWNPRWRWWRSRFPAPCRRRARSGFGTGYEKRKLPVPSSASESHGPPSLVSDRSRRAGCWWRSPDRGWCREPHRRPGWRVRAPPICTVTVMVWGASTALGSLTVTMPVAIPAGRPEVFKANWSGVQTPGRDEQARWAPTEAPIQETDDARLQIERTVEQSL